MNNYRNLRCGVKNEERKVKNIKTLAFNCYNKRGSIMRKSKRTMLYSALICFAFMIVAFMAGCNTEPKSNVAVVQYNVAVEGPDRIEFTYQPDVSANASTYKVYEYAFGNEMDEDLRIMLAVDDGAEAENVSIGYYISGTKTIINDNFKFSATLGAVDIPSGAERWVYVKISVDSATDLASYTKDMIWVGGKPANEYIKVNGVTTTLPSINTGSGEVEIDYSQALQTPAMEEGEVFGGWYSDPFYSTPVDTDDVQEGSEIYAYVYTPSTVTEDDWNTPETCVTMSGTYHQVFTTNGISASMDDGSHIGCGVSTLYIPAEYKGVPVTTVNLDGMTYYDYVYIPATVSTLYMYGTVGMNTEVEIDPENPYFICIDNMYVIERATKTLMFITKGQETEYNIPYGVELIGYCYSNSYKIISATSTMAALNTHFYGQSKTVIIPETVLHMYKHIFYIGSSTIGQVIFKDVTTWYISSTENGSRTPITVTDPTLNAQNLTRSSTNSGTKGYADYFWHKV